jgi:Fur family ferric uptake transcriptional regulator
MTNKAEDYRDLDKRVRSLLHQQGLRVTTPCLMVLRTLARAKGPLSHTEVLEKMDEGDCDPATVYRNLIKLRDAGLVSLVSRAGGIDRYVFTMPGAQGHTHPHFYCTECEQILCLPADTQSLFNLKAPWLEAVQHAICDLRGTCPSCRAKQKTLPPSQK